MALTVEDIHTIKHLFDDQFAAIRGDIDNLALATSAQFAVIDRRFDEVDQQFKGIHTELADIKEDLTVVKHVVKDQGFQITRLEHRTSPNS